MSKLGRLSKQKSVMRIEANPLESGNMTGTSMKVESLSDCNPISQAELATLIKRLESLENNEDRLKLLEELKLPFLFASEQLMKILDITTSLKTKMSMIAQIGPRLVDPRAKTQQFMDLFRFSEEKTQVEEILKARNQALQSSMFSTAGNATGGRGGGRGGLLGGRGGRGAGAAGRGASKPSSTTSTTTAPTTASSSEDANSPLTPGKRVEISPINTNQLDDEYAGAINAQLVMSPTMLINSNVSTPGKDEPIVSDIHDVFSFLDSAGSNSARASRRVTMETIREAGIQEDDEEDDDTDEDDHSEADSEKRAGPEANETIADDISQTTNETAPSSASAMTDKASFSPYSGLPHNLSDASIDLEPSVPSASAEAATAIIAAIVAKEVTNNNNAAMASHSSSVRSLPTLPPVVEEVAELQEAVVAKPIEVEDVTVAETKAAEVVPSTTTTKEDVATVSEAMASTRSEDKPEVVAPVAPVAAEVEVPVPVIHSTKPNNLAVNTSLSRQGSARNSPRNGWGDSPLDLGRTASPRTTSMEKSKSLHASSFTLGVKEREELLQHTTASAASSSGRVTAAKYSSVSDKEAAIASVQAPPMRGTIFRAHSELIISPKDAAVGAHFSPSISSKGPLCNADDLASRYAALLQMTKADFLALEPAAPVAYQNDLPQYTYAELLRRNFQKDFGDLKSTELPSYLRDEEFEKVFQKTKEQFNGLAKWRQVEQKKRAYLF